MASKRERVLDVLARGLDEWNGRENWPPHVSRDEADFLIKRLEERGLMSQLGDL